MCIQPVWLSGMRSLGWRMRTVPLTAVPMWAPPVVRDLFTAIIQPESQIRTRATQPSHKTLMTLYTSGRADQTKFSSHSPHGKWLTPLHCTTSLMRTIRDYPSCGSLPCLKTLKSPIEPAPHIPRECLMQCSLVMKAQGWETRPGMCHSTLPRYWWWRGLPRTISSTSVRSNSSQVMQVCMWEMHSVLS